MAQEVRDQVVDVEPTDAISAVGSNVQSKVSQSEASADVAPAAPSCETIPATHSYQIKPLLQDRFNPNVIKDIIRSALGEKLAGKTYESDKVQQWSVDLSNEISQKVIELKMKRYKHIIQVTLGQLNGAGVKSGVRCIWDSETDGYTSEIFSNDTIFCLVAVYAIYHY